MHKRVRKQLSQDAGEAPSWIVSYHYNTDVRTIAHTTEPVPNYDGGCFTIALNAERAIWANILYGLKAVVF